MKIAIATNDRKTIAKRTGRAKEFAIYTIENAEVQSIDYQKNTHTHHDHDKNKGNHRQGHGSGDGHGEHNHNEIITQLKGIDMFLVKAVGKYMKKNLIAGAIPFQIVKKEEIKEIIASYLEKL